MGFLSLCGCFGRNTMVVDPQAQQVGGGSVPLPNDSAELWEEVAGLTGSTVAPAVVSGSVSGLDMPATTGHLNESSLSEISLENPKADEVGEYTAAIGGESAPVIEQPQLISPAIILETWTTSDTHHSAPEASSASVGTE